VEPLVPVFAIQTGRPESRNGKERINTTLTTLNIAVFAPIPRTEDEHGDSAEAHVAPQGS